MADTTRYTTAAARKKAATKGDALPGGSFPIQNRAQLARARQAVGRSKDPEAARALIRRRAKELDVSLKGSTIAKGHLTPIAKSDRPSQGSASPGRLVTAGLFPGYHAAFAGRKGRKLRAAGHEIVGGAVGSVVPGPGTAIGAAVGANIANKKGYYKRESVQKGSDLLHVGPTVVGHGIGEGARRATRGRRGSFKITTEDPRPSRRRQISVRASLGGVAVAGGAAGGAVAHKVLPDGSKIQNGSVITKAAAPLASTAERSKWTQGQRNMADRTTRSVAQGGRWAGAATGAAVGAALGRGNRVLGAEAGGAGGYLAGHVAGVERGLHQGAAVGRRQHIATNAKRAERKAQQAGQVSKRAGANAFGVVHS